MEYRRVYARIDLDAMGHNLDLIRAKIPTGNRLMMVIKADAYGHGALAIARAFEHCADAFAVAEMNEALELRAGGIRLPILILGYTSPHCFRDALTHDITLTMFQYDAIEKLSALAVSMGKRAKVHFAVDTGMSRIGWQVCETDADEAARAARLPGITAEGIFTHFAAADGTDKAPSAEQRAEFERFLSMLAARGVLIPIRHIDNSAGILNFDRHYDMVRAGIILYGLYPSDEVHDELGERFKLHPVMSLMTHISHIKELETGQGISYGFTYVTDRKIRVATLPVGYADGYPRALSGSAEVLIHGKRCPILGRICMDQMMVDVSDVPEARIEDTVVLVGRDGNEEISVEELADAAYSFNYEFVCGVARRVPRVYFRDGKPCETVLNMKIK